VSRQPDVEISWSLEIEKGLTQGLQLRQWQLSDAGFLLGGENTAASLQQA
jgi:hypothetical protein